MEKMTRGGPTLFRLWIAAYTDWQPMHWNQSPPRATAVEPVEDMLYTAAEAATFVESFNRSMLSADQPVWAVAVPITIRYEGDVEPGMTVEGHTFPLDQLDSGSETSSGPPAIESSRTVSSSSTIGSPPTQLSAAPGPNAEHHVQGFDQSPQRSR